jgi:transketolase
MDRLETILNLEPLANRFSAFGWNTIEVNGHDFSELGKVLQSPSQGKPKAVIAHTTKGKGVSFMEDIALWHMRMPNSDELKTLLGELNLTQAELEAL